MTNDDDVGDCSVVICLFYVHFCNCFGIVFFFFRFFSSGSRNFVLIDIFKIACARGGSLLCCFILLYGNGNLNFRWILCAFIGMWPRKLFFFSFISKWMDRAVFLFILLSIFFFLSLLCFAMFIHIHIYTHTNT